MQPKHRAPSRQLPRRRTLIAAGIFALVLVTGAPFWSMGATADSVLTTDQMRQACHDRLAQGTAGLPSGSVNWLRNCASVAPAPTVTPSGTVTTPPPSPSPTVTVSPTPTTPSPSPTTNSPSPTPTPTATAGGCPAFPAFPDSSCTGWKHTGVTLHLCNVSQIDATATYDSCFFPNGLIINAANVVITRSMIHGDVSPHWSSNYDMRGLKLTDVEIEGCSATTIAGAAGCDVPNPNLDHCCAALAGSNFTAVRVDAHNTDTGIHLGDNSVLQDSYVHSFDYVTGDHGAAAGEGQGTGFHSRLIHNNLDCARLPGQTQTCSSALSLYDEPTLDDVLVQNNSLATIDGYGGYFGGPNGTNIRVLNNVFSQKYYPQCGYYGPVAAYYPNNTGNQFVGNVFSDGTPVTPFSGA